MISSSPQGGWGTCFKHCSRSERLIAHTARVCSVQVAILLIRKIIGSLNKQDRLELGQAFLQNDASNPTYKGFKTHVPRRGAVPRSARPCIVLKRRGSGAASWHVSESNFRG